MKLSSNYFWKNERHIWVGINIKKKKGKDEERLGSFNQQRAKILVCSNKDSAPIFQLYLAEDKKKRKCSSRIHIWILIDREIVARSKKSVIWFWLTLHWFLSVYSNYWKVELCLLVLAVSSFHGHITINGTLKWTILDVHFRWYMWFSVWKRREPRVGRPEVDALCVFVSEVVVRRRHLPWGPSRHLESPRRDCDRCFLDHFAWNRYASSPRPGPWYANPPRFSAGTTISSETSTHRDFNQSSKQERIPSSKDAELSLSKRKAALCRLMLSEVVSQSFRPRFRSSW